MCGNSCNCVGMCALTASTSAAPADLPVNIGRLTSKTPAKRTLGSKLDLWDKRSEQALAWVLAFADEHAEEILTVARARHITGHHVHGDGEMYEYTRGRLAKEVIEELADAVNYSVRRLSI